jgi:spermidine synthase
MPHSVYIFLAVDAHVVSIGEDGGRAALLVDGVVQSISPEDGLASGGYWAAMVPPLRPRRALILGMGGGTLARLLHARWGSSVAVVGVDDDVAIVETALAAGWLSESIASVVIADAFAFVESCQDRFDYVAIDLFRGEQLARRAFTRPFLRRVRSLLQSPAMLVANMFADRRAAQRIGRIEAVFEVRDRVAVGGNLVIHARARRNRA